MPRQTAPQRPEIPPRGRRHEPFADAEQAWFWTMGALRARHEGGRSGGGGGIPRPCDPDDIIRCLDQLFRRGRIGVAHARVLRVWGERQMPPRGAAGDTPMEEKLWHEALAQLERVLQAKGVVISHI